MILGEVVELGPHRLLCGDAFNHYHVQTLLRDEKPDMLYMDPPYNIGLHDPDKRTYRVVNHKNGSRHVYAAAGKTVIGDDRPFDPQPLFHRFAATQEQFWWGADYYADRLPNRNDGAWVVWDKRVDVRLDPGFGSCFELCWSCKRHKREIARIPWSGFIGIRDEPDGKRFHPTQKPVALAEWFFERYSKPGALVLDLFGGSGSTLLACERMGRRCCMAEISPDYCQVIIDRYHALTRQPRLEGVA